MDNEYLGLGLAQGFENATNNFFNAMSAVRNARLTQQKNDIEAKKAGLEIKKMELELDPETVAQNKQLLTAKIKAQKSLDELNIIKAQREAGKVKDEAKRSALALDFFNSVASDPKTRGRLGISATGSLYYKPQDSLFSDINIPTQQEPGLINRIKKFFTGNGAPQTAAPTPAAAPAAVKPVADVRAKARQTLQEAGYDDSDSSVDVFLKQNPNFA